MVTGAYIDQLAKQLSPFKGKEVPENLVEQFSALDMDGQQAVRDRLRSLLNGTAQAAITPKPERPVKSKPELPQKRLLLLDILNGPGEHRVADLARKLNTTPNSVCAMMSVLRQTGHRIISSRREGRHGSRTFRVAPDITLTGEPTSPLSRAERGARGARTARGLPRRPPGQFDFEALRILENAGEAGLTITQWAAAMNVTTGSLYRRITTMRRNGNDVGLIRSPDSRLAHYIWRGKPSAQGALFGQNDAPLIMSRKDAAELFSVSVTTIRAWVRRGLIPPPQAYIRDRCVVYGWEESAIEKMLESYPENGFPRGWARQHDAAAPEGITSEGIDDEPIVESLQPHIETEMVAELPPEPEPAAPPATLATLLVELRPSLMEAIRRDAADRHEELLAAVQSLRADRQTERMPAVAALRALDLHLHPGFDVDSILDELTAGSDARSVRDWLSKMQGKIKRLAQRAAEQV